MKLNRIITLCAVAATLALSAGSLLAQDNNGGDNGGRRQRGGGNFDPAQFQQRMLDRVKDELNFTNETDWDAVQPLVQKVMDAQRDVRGEQFRGMMGGRTRGGSRGGDQGGDQGGRTRGGGTGGGMFGAPSPEREALQKALDDNAPAAQVKGLLAKYQAAQKAKQAKLEQAQSDLRAVLNSKQEAQATLVGLLN